MLRDDEQDCDPKPNSNWASNTEAVSTSNDCAFTCTGNTVQNTQDKTCDAPNSGVWYNRGTDRRTAPPSPIENSGLFPHPH